MRSPILLAVLDPAAVEAVVRDAGLSGDSPWTEIQDAIEAVLLDRLPGGIEDAEWDAVATRISRKADRYTHRYLNPEPTPIEV